MIVAFIKRDIWLHYKNPSFFIRPVLFFISSLLILPFIVGEDPDLLSDLSPYFFILIMMFAYLIDFGALFSEDIKDRSLAQLMMATKHSLAGFILVRLLTVACIRFLSLAVLTPLLFVLFYYPFIKGADLLLVLLFSSVMMTSLDGVFSSLAVMMKEKKALFVFLAVPFLVPLIVITGRLALPVSSDQTGTLFLLLLSLVLIMVPITFLLAFLALRYTLYHE